MGDAVCITRGGGESSTPLPAPRPPPLVLREALGSPPTAYITALVLLQILGEPTHCGDHEVVICEVLSHETVNPSARPLYTGLLRELGKL